MEYETAPEQGTSAGDYLEVRRWRLEKKQQLPPGPKRKRSPLTAAWKEHAAAEGAIFVVLDRKSVV